MRQSGRKPNQSINPAKMTNEIKKSISDTITELAGMIRRGKYTLVSRFWLSIRELELSARVLAKNCQGNMAA